MAQIVDQFGNPIDREVLIEPQTAKLRNLKLEFASHPSRGLTPAKLASILESAEQGDLVGQAELFTDMEEKDGHILAEMGKRKRALLTLPWDVVPPLAATAAEKSLAQEVKEWLAAREDLDDLIFDLMDAAGHAYSCVEIEWARLGREWHPAKFHHRLPTWFQLDRETRTELRLRDNSAAGQALRPFGWVVHIHKAKSGHLARAGLHRALAWPYLFKNYSVRDLAEFLEIYGLPLRVGTYPAGTGPDEKTTLLNAVVGIGHNAAGIIPQGMAIEFQEAAKGTHEPFAAMIDWCERTESKVIVGQVLSAEAKNTGLGSGVADLQSEVRADIKVSDARQLSGTISRGVIYPWVAINRGVTDPRRSPRFRFDTQEPEDLKLYAESLPALVNMGMKIPTAYAHDRLKIPVPKENEDVLQPAPPILPAGAALRSRLALAATGSGTVGSRIAEAVDDQVALAEAAGDLAAGWLEDLGPRVDELVAMAESTGDLVTFRERLAELMAAPPASALAQSIERSAFIARLLGRTDNR